MIMMEKYISKIHYLFVFLIIAISCDMQQDISWKVDEIPSRLVVEGSITDELKKHTVRLSKTDNYFSNRKAESVSNAVVTISDGENMFSLEENPSGSGIYEVRGVVGRIYTLDIEIDEPLNNEVHFTANSVLNESIRTDTMICFLYDSPFIFDEADTVILVIDILGKEPEPAGDYYLINLYRNGELLNDTIDEYNTLHDETYGINGEFIISFYYNEYFEVDDTVDLEIRSINREYYEFIKGVATISGGTDPFGFSGPPANPAGNISGGNALGFFIASSVTRISSTVMIPEIE
jgi:hypothetical protein